MKKDFKNILILSIMSVFIFPCNCKWGDKNDLPKQKLQIPPHELILQDYFSDHNRGKWKDLDEEHSPIVSINKSKREITITASAPFASRSGHYSEMILLTDYQLKEMNKKTFSKADPGPVKAVFTLPVFSRGEFYILLKCNLHDTWYKKILIN